jgi:hypothetical protein
MVSFIFHRMQEDRVDGAGGVGKWSDCPSFAAWCYPFNLTVMAAWAARVAGGGDWDYKRQLAAKWGTAVAVPHDPAPEMLFYDVFTNIHYGYVGRAHNIPADILHAGAEQLGGVRTVSDWVSNEMGIRLWERRGLGLTQPDVAATVIARMKSYRTDPYRQYREVQPGLWR